MKKIIMIGSNPRTRHLIPWEADAEFYTLNEAPMNAWMKRWDVLFQLHKRWDWDRLNNLAHPNHPLFIKAQSGECLYCKGAGKAYADGKEVACPWCVDGVYTVPDHRFSNVENFGDGVTVKTGKTIIMQDDNEDVPGCVKFPLESIEILLDGIYLTSTLAHMLVYAIHQHRDAEIELYGFEAESSTEYAAQRPCIEYWVGYGRGLGMSIEAPGSGLLTGKHYAYNDYDQGYRSRLELRKHELQKQLNAAEIESVKSEGELNALTPYREVPVIEAAWGKAFDDHFRKKNFVSFLRGTLKELDRVIEILDAYRQDTDEATQADMRRLVEIPYSLG